MCVAYSTVAPRTCGPPPKEPIPQHPPRNRFYSAGTPTELSSTPQVATKGAPAPPRPKDSHLTIMSSELLQHMNPCGIQSATHLGLPAQPPEQVLAHHRPTDLVRHE
jgi:hypothetical protein